MQKTQRKLTLKSTTIATLTSLQLVDAKGGAAFIEETEPYSACGLCIPYTRSWNRDC